MIASAGGAPSHPDWFHNLTAIPRVTVEDGVFTYAAEAEVLAGAERDAAFARAVERDPGWAEYQAKTSRVIPVVALRAIESGPPNVTGATSWGDGLKAVHDGIRRELGLIRKEIAESGPGLGAQLRINCLTLCKGLHNHHAGEDAALFPFIGSRHPELGAVLELMREEHERIAALLAQLQETVSTDGADPGLVLPEVERLTDELERHLLHEEEQLIRSWTRQRCRASGPTSRHVKSLCRRTDHDKASGRNPLTTTPPVATPLPTRPLHEDRSGHLGDPRREGVQVAHGTGDPLVERERLLVTKPALSLGCRLPRR